MITGPSKKHKTLAIGHGKTFKEERKKKGQIFVSFTLKEGESQDTLIKSESKPRGGGGRGMQWSFKKLA